MNADVDDIAGHCKWYENHLAVGAMGNGLALCGNGLYLDVF